MTPRTDREIWWVGFKPDEKLEAVWADFARDLEKENAALRIEINRLRVALRDIADASTGQLTLPMWIRGKVAKTLGQEAQP